jgi:hypothetical protein
MPKYYYFAFSDCNDPSREEEYNDWYSNTHIPDMLETPGMIRATRWESADSGDKTVRKYLALYEFETDDLEDFNRKVGIVGKSTMDRGRFSELPIFDPGNVPRIYRQIMPVKEADKNKQKKWLERM